jgi:hypothetical protein
MTGDNGQPQGDPLADDEGRPAHDQREDEEERTLVAAGEHDQQGREGDRNRALDEEFRDPKRGRREQVMDEQDEGADDGQQHENRLLRVRPQPGQGDDGGGRRDEHPAGDAHHPVVGPSGDIRDGGGVGSLKAAQHRLGRIEQSGVGSVDVRRAPAPQERWHENRRHDDEIRHHGQNDERQNGLDRHPCGVLRGRRAISLAWGPW